MRANNDIFVNTIAFALENTIEQYEGKEDETSKIIYEMLRSSKDVWESVHTYFIERIGMTYEDFLKQLKERKNIIFFTDEEMMRFNKAIKIMEIIKE